ncbi:PQ loop repeat-domain-containing protein [Scheffersomyces amazonensis]|uniref:PQ loop repeat-domain-containing protein n=1 Tax=Scheffersomyces amazonensis TaxID=1078765 RepID=UPI00315CB468
MISVVAENVLGTAGTIFWCIQLVPQIIRNYKVKDCEGLPPLMMFLWAACGVPFSIYFVGTSGSIPLQIQPQLFTFFCTVSWAQTLYYPPYQLPRKRMIFYVTSFVLISIGLELGFILWLRPVYNHGTHWPMLIMGILASILLALGLIPPYFELAKRQGRVVGINFVFLFMDSMGALLSMLSIIVGTFDVMSMVLYVIVLVLEIGIATSHIIWYFRMGKRILKEEKAQAELEAETKLELEDTSDQECADKLTVDMEISHSLRSEEI